MIEWIRSRPVYRSFKTNPALAPLEEDVQQVS